MTSRNSDSDDLLVTPLDHAVYTALMLSCVGALIFMAALAYSDAVARADAAPIGCEHYRGAEAAACVVELR